jgi:anti-anti-sigma factor
VTGQLDLNSAGQFTEAVSAELARTSDPCLIIDLAGLVFWDVFGIAALLRARAQADATPSARLVLADVPGPMLQQLRETGLGGRFPIADSADEACGGVSPPS